MAEINHALEIRGTLKDVYEALTNIEKLSNWWTTKTEGLSEVGNSIQFRFGEHGGFEMKVMDLKPNERVVWKCTSGAEEWVGTELSFRITQVGQFVKLRFCHSKWKEASDFLAHCSTKWAVFLFSLKEFVETGSGRPYPYDVQITQNKCD